MCREVDAVDSEHSKNIEQDSWRFYILNRLLANKDHPFHKFGTGNKSNVSIGLPEALSHVKEGAFSRPVKS